MFKKLVSMSLGVLMFANLFSAVSFAANVDTNLVLGANLVLINSDDQVFDPAESEEMEIQLSMNSGSFASQLQNASGYVQISKDGSVVRTLATWNNEDLSNPTLPAWNGADIDATDEAEAICGDQGDPCPAGVYDLEVHVEHEVNPELTLYDTDSVEFNIGGVTTISIDSFTVTSSGGGNFDPAPDADDEVLLIEYQLSGEPDDVDVVIRDQFNKTVQSYSENLQSHTFAWDGVSSGKLIEPGTYTVNFTARVTGEEPVTAQESFEVFYSNSNRPTISGFDVSPDRFDPDTESAIIQFRNDQDAEVYLEIRDQNNSVIKGFSEYNGNDEYDQNTNHDVSWDGTYDNGIRADQGDYTVYVKTINDYGVVVKSEEIEIYNDGSSSSGSSNSHIRDIRFSPSNNFEPAEDDYLEIEFDVEEDLDELRVYAIRGAESIELFDDEDVDEENNMVIEWDGEDEDGDYVDNGSWRIEFRSERGSANKVASKNILVEYDEPTVEDIFLSKQKFDAENGESTYIIFKISEDAEVTIEVLEDDEVEDEIEEDMEVEGGKWYAVQWDGDNYDEDDDLDIKLTASNLANEDIIDTEKVRVDIKEESFENRLNLYNDFVDPVVSAPGDNIDIYYELDGDAEITISIHRGENGTGSEEIVLIEDYEHESGGYNLTWDARDENGKKLSGTYSYKIVAKNSYATDTEKGAFRIGAVGEVSGSSSIGGGGSSSSGGKAPNVIVNGVKLSQGSGSSGGCAGFKDVSVNNKYCNAITWAKAAGVVEGFKDNTFKANSPITRMELLKVILEGMNISAPEGNYGKLGFSDTVASDWYIRYLKKAKDLNIFDGDSNRNTARPYDNINRAEALKILFEALRVETGYSAQTCSNPYSDVANVWYNKYFCSSKNLGLLDPVQGNIAAPGINITRGEVTEMLYRLAQK